MSNFDVLLVGGGASAVFTALQFTRELPRWRIGWVGEQPGVGLAYETSSVRHLLNVPAQRMGAFPDAVDDFDRWLRNSSTHHAGAFDMFVPRGLYGGYLAALRQQALGSGQITVVDGRALDCRRAPGAEWRVALADGGTVGSARVVLAPGLPSMGSDWPAHPALVADAWSWWLALRSDWQPPSARETIVLVGSGLTAMDMVVGLRERGFEGPIRVLSRSGRWSTAHADTTPLDAAAQQQLIAALQRRPSARNYVRSLRRAAAQYPWRAVIDALRPHSQLLWQALPTLEQRRVLRHGFSPWNRLRHRAPPVTARAVAEDPRVSIERVRVTSRVAEQLTQSSALVLNCGGPTLGRGGRWPALLEGLIADGHVRVNALKTGLQSALPAELALLGAVRFGELFECTAVPELRQHAAELARFWRGA
jgi:hydroxyacylglutathione hydrolase